MYANSNSIRWKLNFCVICVVLCVTWYFINDRCISGGLQMFWTTFCILRLTKRNKKACFPTHIYLKKRFCILRLTYTRIKSSTFNRRSGKPSLCCDFGSTFAIEVGAPSGGIRLETRYLLKHSLTKLQVWYTRDVVQAGLQFFSLQWYSRGVVHSRHFPKCHQSTCHSLNRWVTFSLYDTNTHTNESKESRFTNCFHDIYICFHTSMLWSRLLVLIIRFIVWEQNMRLIPFIFFVLHFSLLIPVFRFLFFG